MTSSVRSAKKSAGESSDSPRSARKSAGNSSNSDTMSDSDSEDDISLNQFKKLLIKKGRIGEGGFARVYKCKHALDDQFYAVKKISIHHSQLDWSLREVKALSILRHKNIVRYYQSWTDGSTLGFTPDTQTSSEEDCQSSSAGSAKLKADLYLYIQMEFCPSNLNGWLNMKNKISILKAWYFLSDLLEALMYIHEEGFVHRDLSKNNIFIGSDNNIKVGDFGLAKKLTGPEDNMHCSQSRHSFSIGQALYKAPELEDKASPYTRKSDVYSLGVVFLEMLLHAMNFDLREQDRAMTNLKQKGTFPDGWEEKDEIGILKLMLAKSPEDRATAEQLYQLVKQQIAEKSPVSSSKETD